MREIKFRIWDKQNKTWLENSCSLYCFSNWSICPFTGRLTDYVGAIDGDHGDKYTASPAPDYYMQDGKIVKDSRYVIQQYIGMKDCNNVEIYEGDIVTFKPKSDKPPFWEVVYDVDLAIFCLYNRKKEKYFEYESDIRGHICGGDLRIIGNIFENPELLK